MSILTSVFTAVLLLLLVVFNSNQSGCPSSGIVQSDQSAGFSLDQDPLTQPSLHRGSGRLDVGQCAA
jgi:hypothetical protein